MVYFVNALALASLHVHDLGSGGSLGGLLLSQSEGTDGSMGQTYICAVVALDALGSVPSGNGHGNAALLISGSALLELAVHMRQEGGNRQAVAVHTAHGEHDVLHLLHNALAGR